MTEHFLARQTKIQTEPAFMSHMSRRIANLSPTKRALFELQQKRKLSEEVNAFTIAKRANQMPIPLSYAQEQLWFLDQLEPGSSAYNIASAIRLSGELNVTALERSIVEILRRHESLRTSFPTENDQPIQRIAPTPVFTLRTVELITTPEEQRETNVQKLTSEEASHPFDLANGPLLRSTLVKLKPQEHLLLLTMHHIVSDAWSIEIFYQELLELYEAFSRGKPSPLPELPIQYADFTVWQRKWLDGEVLREQLSYWIKQLGGSLPILELPTDYPRPTVQTHRGVRCSLELSKDLTGSLKALSRQEGATLFVVLLATFKVLLHRLTAQDDIIVGIPIAGRNKDETERLIGFFVNSLVMRTDLSGNPTFREVIARVRKVAFGAYDHQDLPFEKLVEELKPERSLSRTPLFQVLFNMFSLPDKSIKLTKIDTEIHTVREGSSKFDLTMYIRDHSEGLLLDLIYNADLFHQVTGKRIIAYFSNLLDQVADQQEIRISNLQLLKDQERNKIISHFNDDLDDG
jgi:hypothetical protein